MHPVSCPVLQLLLKGDAPECPNLSHKAQIVEMERSGTLHTNTVPGWTWGANPPGGFISIDLLSLGFVGCSKIPASCAQTRDQFFDLEK